MDYKSKSSGLRVDLVGYKSPKMFDVVFNGACEINRTSTLVRNGAENIFLFT